MEQRKLLLFLIENGKWIIENDCVGFADY